MSEPTRGHVTEFLEWLLTKADNGTAEWGHGEGVRQREALIDAWTAETGQYLSENDRKYVIRGDFAHLKELSEYHSFNLVMMTAVADPSASEPPSDS